MDGEAFDRFCVILANLTPGSAPAWNPGVLKIYEIGLRQVPNALAAPLAELIVDRCTFRPSVAEVKDMVRGLTADAPRLAVDVVAEIRGLLGKYGANGKRRPGTNFYEPGEPPEISDEARRVVALFGGWEGYAQAGTETPVSIMTGYLNKTAQAVVESAPSDTLQRLRLEYGDALKSALAEQAEEGKYGARAALPAHDAPERPVVGRDETAEVMQRIGANVRTLTTKGDRK